MCTLYSPSKASKIASSTKLTTKTGDRLPANHRKPLTGLVNTACLFFEQKRPTGQTIPTFVTLTAIAVLAFALVTPNAAEAEEIVGRASVIDGDTIEIHGTRIRLFAIDAVEARQTCTTHAGRIWPCGREAAFALADHITGKTLACEPLDTDRYGRIVARCFAAGEDIGAWSVAHGWSIAATRYSTIYINVQRQAVAEDRGIWGGTFEDPQTFRKTH